MKRTVKDVTFDLLRKLDLTTIVGNPGSTEESFLKSFPTDFHYVLGLQEASVVSIADGLSQGMRKPVLVNVHTGAGLANAMGSISTAFQAKTPLIITAGQQARAMILNEPLLTNIEASNVPRPYVKWSYEPARAQDVPAALMRAYATAVQQPSGPVFLSIPMDDWDREMDEVDVFRTVSTRFGPDPARIKEFAQKINDSKNPALVYGSDIARSNAWDAGIQFAERLQAKVYAAPLAERTPFPETHPLYAGSLPPAIAPLANSLRGHDLIVVIGAPVFRYYPYVPGPYLPDGARLLQITDDPNASSKAAVGDSLVSDSLLFLEAITSLVNARQASATVAKAPDAPPSQISTAEPLSASAVFKMLKPLFPKEFVLLEESPSNFIELTQCFKIDRPDCFYTFASGALGWNMPAGVGLALAEKKSGRGRPVIVVMGDGSFQYSVQSIYTAVQENAHVVFLTLCNGEYAVLKQFAQLEQTPNVPGLDLPGLHIASLGEGYGARSTHAKTADQVRRAFIAALEFKGTSVIEVPIAKGRPSLLDA